MAHPFYRKKYTHDSISELQHNIDDVLYVHGGVTYSGELEWALVYNRSIPRNQWWFGFDCCHGSDAQDPDLIHDPMAKKIAIEMEVALSSLKHAHRTHKSLEYVEQNCNDLAEHLSKFIYNSVDFILSEEDSNLHAVSNGI